MKYRIKIYTYKNGRKEYKAQVRRFMSWNTINYDGSYDGIFFETTFDNGREALEAIDGHYNGNAKLKSIEFEYITKM